MMRIKVLASLVVLLMVPCINGCGGYGAGGPITLDNAVNGYPPKIRGVAVNLTAGLLTVDYQPYDARTPQVQAWYFATDAGSCQKQYVNVSTNNGNSSTMNGRATYTLSNLPVSSSIPVMFQITVTEPEACDGELQPRQTSEVWQIQDGVIKQIS